MLGAGEFLLSQQNADGRFGPDCTASLYNHSLACLALLTLDERVMASTDALTTGLRLLVEAQQPAGGWSYLRAPQGKANSSLTSWALLALLRARERDLPVSDDAIARGFAWLEQTVNQEGRAGYRRADDFPRGPETLTAATALCLLQDATPDRERLQKMLSHVRADLAQDVQGMDYYRTYFQTAALREAGLHGTDELQQVEARLLALQDTQAPAHGSWPALDLWSRAGGRVYTTAMAVLSLRDLR